MYRRRILREIGLILSQLVAFAYYAWLRISNADIVHEARSFGDIGEYQYIASLPVFSREFWTESKPPLTSLLWKLVESDTEKIFAAQLYISIICWGILALAVAAVIRAYSIKPFAFAVILAFSLSRDIYMWDPFLGSESLALSFMALFLACSLWLLKEWKWHKAILLLITSLLMVFTRDTYAYLLLLLALIILPAFWLTTFRPRVAIISVGFLLIFIISSGLAAAGLRPFRALLMITALRIYPSEEYTQYFRHHGMPIDESLVELSRVPRENKFAVYSALYKDPDQDRYREWVHQNGRREYIRFLWFYKADTLQKVFLETPSQSFFPDVYYYTATGYHPIIKDIRISEILYPTRFGLLFFFVANLLAAFIVPFAWRQRKTLWLVPLLMILLTYPQAVLVWAGDANDIARHSISHNILLRLGVWMLVFFIADFLLVDFLPRVKSLWPRTPTAT